ncbi:MAG: hypothetical protein H7A45_02790 [Verrucomicrobiales bacterium]|nr:hypothetical protein [Verrucomicrobiales bacterium]
MTSKTLASILLLVTPSLNLTAAGLDSWERVTVSASGQKIFGVATGDGWWAAITEDNSPNGHVLRSRDGRTWESWKVPHETSTTRGVDLYDVAVGDGRIIAVGRQLSANKSVIANWPLDAAAGAKPKYYSTSARLLGVVFAQGQFTASGDKGALFSVAADGTATPLATVSSTDSLRAVAFGGHPGRYAAFELQASQVWVSDDRTEWTPATIPGGQVTWVDIAHVGDRFVAVGNIGTASNGVIAWSLDGLHWERRDPSGYTSLTSVGGGVGQFFVSKGGSSAAGLWRGADIGNLKSVSLPGITPVTDIAYNGFQFLAVGADGAGWLSGEIHGFDYARLRPRDEPVRFDFVAAHGRRHRLEKSSNLRDWELLLDDVGQGNLIQFEHPARHPDHEYYRMTVLP